MDLTINIEEYLDKEEIKEECRSAIRHAIYEKYKSEAEIDRLITNLSYEFIFNAVSECINEDAVEKIKKGVMKILDKGTYAFELFRKRDAWERSEAPALTILNQAIKDNEQLIRDKVVNAITEYDFGSAEELKDRIQDTFADILEEKLFRKGA